MTHAPTPIELVMIASAVQHDEPEAYTDLTGPYVTTLADAGSLTINLLGLAVGLTGMMGVPAPTITHAGQPITSGSSSFPPAPLVLTSALLALVAEGKSNDAGREYVATITAAAGDERAVFVRQTLQLAAEILATVLHARPVPRTV